MCWYLRYKRVFYFFSFKSHLKSIVPSYDLFRSSLVAFSQSYQSSAFIDQTFNQYIYLFWLFHCSHTFCFPFRYVLHCYVLSQYVSRSAHSSSFKYPNYALPSLKSFFIFIFFLISYFPVSLLVFQKILKFKTNKKWIN